MKTQIESLSEWIKSFCIDTVPRDTLEQSKLQVLDCMASIAAGSRSKPGKKIYDALKNVSSGNGEHIIFPSGEMWSLENAVYLHAALINSLEMDNFSYMGHLSQSAFPVAFAITEKRGATGQDFLESFICAQEVSGRLSAYMASGPLQGHMRSFVHRIGAAVATVKLYNCEPGVIANAISISLSSPEFPMFPTSFSPETKITCVSSATVEGMRSAFLAMSGLEGTLDLIEHPAGFVRTFSKHNDLPDFWKSLGKTWVMDSVSFKYYASCAYAQGPVNAVLSAIDTDKIRPEDIKIVRLHCPVLTVVMEDFSKPHYNAGLNPVNINFSTKNSVSAAILYRGLDGSFFADGNDEEYHERIIALSKKVNIHHSWKLTIEMIMGMDACLENPGYPGVFDTGSSDSTLKTLKKVYRNRTLFNLTELGQFFTLPKGYFYYLVCRVLKSFAGRIGWSDRRSHEHNLSMLQFKIGTVAEIRMQNGTVHSAKCEIPKGFAGDPEKKARVIEKFERECNPIYGEKRTIHLRKTIMETGFPGIANH